MEREEGEEKGDENQPLTTLSQLQPARRGGGDDTALPLDEAAPGYITEKVDWQRESDRVENSLEKIPLLFKYE